MSNVIRYYQVRPPEGRRAYTKTRPVTLDVLSPALRWIRHGVADANSWEVPADDVRANNYDLDLLPPDVMKQLDPGVVGGRLGEFAQQAASVASLAGALAAIPGEQGSYRLTGMNQLGEWIEQGGARSREDQPPRFIGVSNSGGLVPFKGSVARDTSRYRRVNAGDFVYNPMRINVGSIALCRTDAEAGYASPDYVVFRLRENAPFSTDYLLRYLQSSLGQRQIERNAQRTIRSRLYFDNLSDIQVPIPADRGAWDELLTGLRELQQLLIQLPGDASAALINLVDSLYLFTPSPAAAGVSERAV